VPLPSEAALFAYLQLHPENLTVAVLTATFGNTAGGTTSYAIGRFLPEGPLKQKPLQFVKRYGAAALLLAWLPLVGDALCIAAGWLRMRWPAALACMAAGRLARYVVIAWMA
jgi:membrane protein YqaA with SNARE-associated domain